MKRKEKLIGWLEESHQNIEKLVSQVDQKLEIYPGWTIREILAHFTGWDDAVITSLKSHAVGGVPTVVAEGDHNFHNTTTLAQREVFSFERIYQDWQQTHEQLKIAIRDLPPGKIEAQFVFPWGQTGNIEDLVIGLTTEHEMSHMQDIRALLQKDK